MVEIAQLDRLSLVSRVCTELENHININDKDLGEIRSIHSACGDSYCSEKDNPARL